MVRAEQSHTLPRQENENKPQQNTNRGLYLKGLWRGGGPSATSRIPPARSASSHRSAPQLTCPQSPTPWQAPGDRERQPLGPSCRHAPTGPHAVLRPELLSSNRAASAGNRLLPAGSGPRGVGRGQGGSQSEGAGLQASRRLATPARRRSWREAVHPAGAAEGMRMRRRYRGRHQ